LPRAELRRSGGRKSDAGIFGLPLLASARYRTNPLAFNRARPAAAASARVLFAALAAERFSGNTMTRPQLSRTGGLASRIALAHSRRAQRRQPPVRRGRPAAAVIDGLPKARPPRAAEAQREITGPGAMFRLRASQARRARHRALRLRHA